MNKTSPVYFEFNFYAKKPELLTAKLASTFDSLFRRKKKAFLSPRLTQFLLIICKVYIKAHQTVRGTQIKADLKDIHANRPSHKPISAEMINGAVIWVSECFLTPELEHVRVVLF